jgi:hypothetical protein
VLILHDRNRWVKKVRTFHFHTIYVTSTSRTAN